MTVTAVNACYVRSRVGVLRDPQDEPENVLALLDVPIPERAENNLTIGRYCDPINHSGFVVSRNQMFEVVPAADLQRPCLNFTKRLEPDIVVGKESGAFPKVRHLQAEEATFNIATTGQIRALRIPSEFCSRLRRLIVGLKQLGHRIKQFLIVLSHLPNGGRGVSCNTISSHPSDRRMGVKHVVHAGCHQA